jgi:hypothetical protein
MGKCVNDYLVLVIVKFRDVSIVYRKSKLFLIGEFRGTLNLNHHHDEVSYCCFKFTHFVLKI